MLILRTLCAGGAQLKYEQVYILGTMGKSLFSLYFIVKLNFLWLVITGLRSLHTIKEIASG